jgi:hypothetical protein
MDLTIDVGFRHMVHIDESESPYPTAGQRLCRPRANSTDTDHHNMCASHLLGWHITVQAVQTKKAPCQINSICVDGQLSGWHKRKGRIPLFDASKSILGR